MKTYENEEICSKCGGKCCKNFPGAYFPSDFKKPLEENILAKLKTGQIELHKNWWSGKYFVIPKILSARYPYQCINLTPTGCALPKKKIVLMNV